MNKKNNKIKKKKEKKMQKKLSSCHIWNNQKIFSDRIKWSRGI